MTSIKGYVENMLEGIAGELTEKQAAYLARIKYNMERLTRMINDLLDLSRIEAKRAGLKVSSLSVAVPSGPNVLQHRSIWRLSRCIS
jgi:signal transduction histidine kinase